MCISVEIHGGTNRLHLKGGGTNYETCNKVKVRRSVFCLAYSWTLKMEETCSSEMSVYSYWLHDVTTQNIIFFNGHL
jgi:hypothetical protein